MKNKVLLLVEGSHEEKFILDFLENGGSLSIKFDEMKVENPNRIDVYVHFHGLTKDIFGIIDWDVSDVRIKHADAQLTAEREGYKLQSIINDPEFGTFIACCFAEFQIDESGSNDEIKNESAAFLIRRDSLTKIKSGTYTDIVRNGGDIKHSGRYYQRFGILNILIFKE